MDNIDVTKYLQNSLKLRVRMLNGTIGSPVDVPQLRASIVTSDVELSPSIRDLPRWGEFRVLMEVDTDDT